MEEINHLLTVNSSGFAVSYDGKAMNNNIEEWFENPEHTIADNPSWGHNLGPFQFCAQTEDDAVMMEMAIVEKLPRDVVGVVIKAIRVTFSELDVCNITIIHNYGSFHNNISVR
ncbi:hypothetical protein QRC94_003770 [Vibrio vulnificus]|uniref:hypothetical protein n=1 Tax=Vibrio vulnificus TaxID=672 RepID=UPI0029406FD6|nr:hypothetical protein [Vibrio vulnificus]ELR8547950.1 hypothetical protein [Vibrio vulnificus]ELR8552704.1 hypothetical protein [Vibrio vulnificus]